MIASTIRLRLTMVACLMAAAGYPCDACAQESRPGKEAPANPNGSTPRLNSDPATLLASAEASLQRGKTLKEAQKYPAAIVAFTAAAKAYDQAKREADAAWIFDWIGDCHRDAKNDVAAVTAYEKCVARFQAIDDKEASAEGVAINARDLGKTLFRLKRYSEAIPAFELAAEAYDKTKQEADAAWIFAWIGDCHRDAKNDEQAVIAYEASLKRFQQIGDGETRAKGVEFNLKRLADVDGRAENWESAIVRRKALWENRRTTLGDEAYQSIDARLDWEHCQMLSSLTSAQRSELVRATQLAADGVQAYKKGQHAKALDATRQASDIRKEVLGEQHPAYSTTLGNMAKLHESMGDYALAEPLFLECLKIRKQVLGEGHPAYARSINDIAAFYRSTGDYARAEPFYLKCLKIRKQALGEQHPDYATTLNNIALLYGVPH